MAKWEDEIKDILANTNWEEQPNLKEIIDQLMPLIMLVVAFVGVFDALKTGIDSPEVRERVRKLLTNWGVPPDKIEQLIAEMVMRTTKPLEGESE